MTFLRLILAGMRHHWRAHLGALAGAVLCTMVLAGSLFVGDSLHGTLRSQARARIGLVKTAVLGGERFFRSAVAAEVAADWAPVILLRGSAAHADGSARLNDVQIVGADARFWALAPDSDRRELEAGDTVVSAALAQRLGLHLGDSLIIRVEKPAAFSKDAPLSGEEDSMEAFRARVAAIAAEAHFGRFALQATQVPPATVFLPLEQLQQRLDVQGKANLLLTSLEPAAAREALTKHWTAEDASLELRPIEGAGAGGVEVRSSRVFLDGDVVKALPAGGRSLTYFVNELRHGEQATPYSMVTAAEPGSLPFLPADLRPDEIISSDWLAEDTGVQAGGELEVKYFVMNAKRQFEERSRKFRVRAVEPLGRNGWDGSWMPNFPGLADAGNCRDWKPGFALDTKRIRDKDEAYWKEHRGAPKGFISLEAGREMWANRWGDLTAIRYSAAEAEQKAPAAKRALSPEASGVQFLPLRQLAFAATNAPVDFAGLFLGFSIFLVASALALVGLLFGLMIENRVREAGTLLAIGWPLRMVRMLFLGEGLGLAAIGAVAGTLLGRLYTRVILRALSSIWKGAIGGATIDFHPTRTSTFLSVAAGTAVALLAMAWVTRHSWKRPARALLEGETLAETGEVARRRNRWIGWVALLFALAGGGLLAQVLTKRQMDPELFFSGGSLFLIALLLGCRKGLELLANRAVRAIRQLAWRNVGRRPGRASAIVAVLASGAFLVLSVQVFRKELPEGPGERSSGTGGFALIGQLATPVYEDLNAAAVRDGLGLPLEPAVHAVSLRVREGEEASCLNLNRAVRPKLIGVPSAELQQLGAFRFVEPGVEWHSLHADTTGPIPAVVDEDTLQWALQKSVGDEVRVPDGRGGEAVLKVVGSIAGSILQGALFIDESAFVRAFPDSGGYRMLLLDVPADKVDDTRAAWSRALQDRGLELVSASRRLSELQAVSNTYLAIFQALGGLGVLLAAVGVGVVAARNVVERRQELAILEAAGWKRTQVARLLVWELALLILLGLVIGGVCAWSVTVPGQWLRGSVVNHRPLALALGSLGSVATLSVAAALLLTLRAKPGEVLRGE